VRAEKGCSIVASALIAGDIGRIAVTVSVGGAVRHGNGPIASVLHRADGLLRQSKRARRGTVTVEDAAAERDGRPARRGETGAGLDRPPSFE
jgi:hypothetical protein